MLIPLSWLKEYVDVTLEPKELGDRLTEIGLGCEKIVKTANDTILELEITPNRPDLLSIIGVAREVAAIENKKIKYPKLITNFKSSSKLPLKIHPNYKITPRITGIIINNVNVSPSPKWLVEKLESIGQRSINNIVDITNYVMFELGNPIHSFDYHKIKNAEMHVEQAKGGEDFESVDNIKYKLPKGAIIYKDSEKIFDLVGIKGGANSGTYANTKAVFIVVEVDDPVLIRKASQKLALRSEASAIFERNVNRGGTIDALKRTTDLILELAGGEIASDLIDLKEQDFKPWKLDLNLQRLEFILGIKIEEKTVINILEKLNLNPKKIKTDLITCEIPTYRNDLQIEEDLIEEVARIYGYNNFPKTLPTGQIPTGIIPHFKDYKLFDIAKNILTAAGFSEIYSYSLISKNDLIENDLLTDSVIKVNNPVSLDFEYLRPNLIINLKKAYKQNAPNFKEINLFELGKIYHGKSLKTAQEPYHLTSISNVLDFAKTKGIIERLIHDLNFNEDKCDYTINTEDNLTIFDFDFSKALANRGKNVAFKPISKYPPITEDLSLETDSNIKIGEIISLIKKQSDLITDVTLIDIYKNSKTFHIIYQNANKNLTNAEVSEIREKIIKNLKEKFFAKIK